MAQCPAQACAHRESWRMSIALFSSVWKGEASPRRANAFARPPSRPPSYFAVRAPLERVPKKLLDFFDSDMLQLFESERCLFDQMSPSDREAF